MTNEYTLDDYNELAYEFAIRNPRVIELLKSTPLTEEIAKELLSTYGISIYKEVGCAVYDDGEAIGSENHIIRSLDELFLDYPHLRGIKTPIHNNHKCFKRIINPISKPRFITKRMETETETFLRISELDISESRGKSNKMKRLINGEVFKHYDAVTFEKQSKYSLDPSTKRKKTINSDIELVKKYIEPDKYMRLLPQLITINHSYREEDYYSLIE